MANAVAWISQAPIFIIQALKRVSGNATSIVVPISPAAGNSLIVCTSAFSGSDNGNVNAITDNIGAATGWTNVASVKMVGTNYASMWYKANIPGRINGVTVSAPAGTTFITAVIHEVAGLNSSPFTAGEFVAYSSQAATTNPQEGPLTNGTANSIFFGCLTSNATGTSVNYTINGTGTVGTWNLFDSTNSQELNATANQPISCPNIVLSKGTAETHGWNTANFAWCGIIACFHT